MSWQAWSWSAQNKQLNFDLFLFSTRSTCYRLQRCRKSQLTRITWLNVTKTSYVYRDPGKNCSAVGFFDTAATCWSSVWWLRLIGGNLTLDIRKTVMLHSFDLHWCFPSRKLRMVANRNWPGKEVDLFFSPYSRVRYAFFASQSQCNVAWELLTMPKAGSARHFTFTYLFIQDCRKSS